MSEGGCLCGASRYRLEGSPRSADFCHCRLCQRAAAAPIVAWGTWPAEDLVWLNGEPSTYASSEKGRRSFCPCCGTPLTFVDLDEPSMVDVALASLDDPTRFAPTRHIWTMSQLPWLDLGDGLPRFRGPADR